jgi:hypothetical protein
METGSVGKPPASLLLALQKLLRPLVRLLLAQGVTYPMLASQLKAVYVQVAKEEFRLTHKRQTDSRISLLTGVHRKDVKRLVHEEPLDQQMPLNISLGSQLAARWLTAAEYLDADGQPLPLFRLASDGGDRSFEALVTSVSKDIRPRALLDEWVRLGVAHIDENDRVCLNVAGFIPEKGFDEKAYYFGQNLHDHIAAGTHNLLGRRPPFLDRSVYQEQLTEASVAELADLARDLGMQNLKTIHRRALQLERRDGAAAQANRRMNFGIYFYSARTDAEDAIPSDKTAQGAKRPEAGEVE